MDSVAVRWDRDSEFLRMIRAYTSRESASYRMTDDPLEPLSVVWEAVRAKFEEGQILDARMIGLLQTIIGRRVSNYFDSPGVGWRKQPGCSIFDHPEAEHLESPCDPPDSVAADREQLALIAAELSRLPPRWAEAIRSRYGYLDAPEWAELVERSGTTRQNVSKLAKKGFEELRRRFG